MRYGSFRKGLEPQMPKIVVICIINTHESPLNLQNTWMSSVVFSLVYVHASRSSFSIYNFSLLTITHFLVFPALFSLLAIVFQCSILLTSHSLLISYSLLLIRHFTPHYITLHDLYFSLPISYSLLLIGHSLQFTFHCSPFLIAHFPLLTLYCTVLTAHF